MFAEFEWFQTMGESPVFIVLIGCSVVTFGATIERLMYFRKRGRNPDPVLQQALREVRLGDVREAARACASCAHPMGAVAATLFRDGDYLREGAEERMRIALSEQKMLLERNLGLLGTMAAAAPLIGLLGTVVGIMRAFHDMSMAGSAAPSIVAGGIAEALVTTAAGLVVAVPALIVYNHLARRLNTLLTVAENHARSLRAALTEPEVHATGSRPTAPAQGPARSEAGAGSWPAGTGAVRTR